MRRVISWLIFLSLVLGLVKPVRATAADVCSEGMIDSITFALNDGNTAVLREDSQTPEPIYKDSSSYYLDSAGTQLINDVGKVTIQHSKAFLDKIAVNGSFFGEDTNIRLIGPGACENENRELKTIKANSGSWDFTYTAGIDDAECVFGKSITLELRESRTGSNLICSRSYVFNTELRGSKGGCVLTMKPEGGATIDSSITIDGKSIDDERVGIRLFLDDQDISPLRWKSGQDNDGRDANGLINFNKIVGNLSVGNYVFDVRYEDGVKEGQTICSMSIPVVASGAEVTPPQQITPGSTSIDVDFAEPIGLCESIPSSANCNNGSCQSKCTSCENRGGIWTGIGCIPANFGGIVTTIFELFSGLIGGLIFICVVVNGFRIMLSGGNAESTKKAKEALTSCIVGFLVLFFSVLFLKIVGVDILNLPGWSS